MVDDNPGLLVLLGITWRRKNNLKQRGTPKIFHLDLAASEERIIQSHGGLDRIFVSELHIRESLGMAIILVAEDRHPEDEQQG